MATIYGTSGPDVVTVPRGDTFFGQAGDDVITMTQWSTAQGEEGNDTLIGNGTEEPTVWYWYSPGPILVDMGAGYALDGYGGRDTLVNVHNVHGFVRNGDQGFGTALSDSFWLGYSANGRGTVVIDGRGGLDTVNIGDTEKTGPMVYRASADGRQVLAQWANNPNLVFDLRNVERLRFSDASGQRTINFIDEVDLTRAGESILLRGGSGWITGAPGAGTSLGYSFMNLAPATGAEGGTGFTAFSAAQQQTVRNVLSLLSEQTGLRFVEAPADQGELRFGINQQSNTRGYSFLPDDFRSDPKGGDVWLDVETAAFLNPGQEGYYVLLHEIAHALGLKHPLPPSDSSGQTVLLDSLATLSNTLMIDVGATALSGAAWPTWYGAFDLQALRFLYGSKLWQAGDTVHAITATQARGGVLLLDEGGTDTLDLSGLAGSAFVDLRAGKNSSAGLSESGISLWNNFAIAPGTVIENLRLTAGDDVATGNDAANGFWSLGGNDIIEGLSGTDTVVLPGARSAWDIARSSAQTEVWNAAARAGGLGSAEMQGIEKLRFDDMLLDLRLAEGQPANQVARLLGAVFGREAAANKEYAGTGLYFMDQLDYSYARLMQLALDVRLGANPSHERLVDLLYTNVIGTAPDAATRKEYVDMLVQGVVTPVTLSIAAANTDFNKANIDLVGLAQTGLAYFQYG